jgi:hypothetical protein
MSSENWNIIIEEYEHLIGRSFFDNQGKVFRLFGLVHGDDDFYYGMISEETSKVRLVSCVGSLVQCGFNLTYSFKSSDGF